MTETGKVLIFTFFSLFLSSYAQNSSLSGCRLRQATTQRVYVGWPQKLSCSYLVEEFGYEIEPESPVDGNDAECIIMDADNNVTIWNATIDVQSWYSLTYTLKFFHTADLTFNSTTRYNVILKVFNSSCTYEAITLDFVASPGLDCQQADEAYQHITLDGENESAKKLSCIVAFDSSEPGLQLDIEKHNYTVTWFRNCTELNTTMHPTIYRQDGKNLIIHSLSYDIAGIYSCSVQYKGLTRFIQHYDVCVKHKTSRGIPLITCPEKVEANIGENVTFSCHISLGFGRISALFLDAEWLQVSGDFNHSCKNSFGHASDGSTPRTRCSLEHRQEDLKCFLYDPSDEEKEAKEIIWIMNFYISDFQAVDIGIYNATFRRFPDFVTSSIWLEESREMATYIYIVIGIAAAVVLVIVVISSILLYKRCR